MQYCIQPFETAKIRPDGSVYCCSASYIFSCSFGNVYKDSFEDIWNGKKAQEFRQQFIDKNYKYCSFEKCRQRKCAELSDDALNKLINKAPYPKKVEIINNDAFKISSEYINGIIAALKNAEYAGIYSPCDLFQNKEMEKLIKKIISVYPEIKFVIGTDGINCDEKHIKKYGLWNRISRVVICLNTGSSINILSDKENEKLIKNIEFLNKLKKENKIRDFNINIRKQGKYPEIEKFAEENDIKVKYTAPDKGICTAPFINFEIHDSGNVYTCCPDYINRYSIGNIWESSLEEIWHSEKAEQLRSKIISGDCSMCDTDICLQTWQTDISIIPPKIQIPKYITLAYDAECNLHCITCRDKQYKNSKEQLEIYNERIYTKLLPILKEADYISISCSGEAFYSAHSRKLIKIAAQENKKALWNIYTNGVLFNTANCKELGIYGRINSVILSLPALDRDIYNTIMRGSDYDTVMKNLKETSYEFNHNKTIKYVSLRMVVSSINYKEIPKLAEFSKEHNFELQLAMFRDFGTELGKDYEKVSVWNKNHPEYSGFKKVLKHQSLNYKRILLQPSFVKIREEN